MVVLCESCTSQSIIFNSSPWQGLLLETQKLSKSKPTKPNLQFVEELVAKWVLESLTRQPQLCAVCSVSLLTVSWLVVSSYYCQNRFLHSVFEPLEASRVGRWELLGSPQGLDFCLHHPVPGLQNGLSFRVSPDSTFPSAAQPEEQAHGSFVTPQGRAAEASSHCR